MAARAAITSEQAIDTSIADRPDVRISPSALIAGAIVDTGDLDLDREVLATADFFGEVFTEEAPKTASAETKAENLLGRKLSFVRSPEGRTCPRALSLPGDKSSEEGQQ